MTKVLPIFIIFISFLFSFYFYPYLPNPMASHWGLDGQVNGFASKNFTVFFLPILLIFLYLLFLFLPKTDPYKKNFIHFQKYFHQFIAIIFLFLFYIYSLTLIWNLGVRFNLNQFLAPAFSLVCYFIGVLLKYAKRNWFVGIRTPWTLHSDRIWNQTHHLGHLLYKSSSFICLLGLVWPQLAFYLIFLPLIIPPIILFFYSYWLYRS